MALTFSIPSAVKLRNLSGTSPVMLVTSSEVEPLTGIERTSVCWFDKDHHLQTAWFDARLLVKVQ